MIFHSTSNDVYPFFLINNWKRFFDNSKRDIESPVWNILYKRCHSLFSTSRRFFGHPSLTPSSYSCHFCGETLLNGFEFGTLFMWLSWRMFVDFVSFCDVRCSIEKWIRNGLESHSYLEYNLVAEFTREIAFVLYFLLNIYIYYC